MKVASFNINNVRRRLPNLLAWLKAAKPDIVCLQEIKCADTEFPAEALRRAHYEAAWQGQKSWNGVAILARGTPLIVTRNGLPGDPTDSQSRYIEAAIKGVLVACAYAPNGNPQPGPKFDYKLRWMKRLARHAASLFRLDAPVVLAGDFNVVPTDQDIYPTRSWDDDALLQPESRQGYARLLKQGWVDAVRALHPKEPMFTFWDYMRQRWERDAGLRLDHILLNARLAPALRAAGVDRFVRGKPNASDHAPVWAALGDISEPRKAESAGSRPRARLSTKAPAASAPNQPTNLPPGRSTRLPLLVIDGDSFAHRAYHALPKTIRRRGNKGAGAIVGFANFLLRFYEMESPRAVLVAWDTLTAPTYRHELFPAYQDGREFDDELLEQLDSLPEFVAACGFVNAKAAGYEADDFVAAAVAVEERRRGTVLVASGDRDTFQLASPRTTILYPVRAGELARIVPAEVRARYGVDPKQVPDFIALRGDPSDKIPGARNVGAKGAAGLLRRYGSLDKLLAAGRFAAQAEQLRLYRAIATMNPKAPLPSLASQKPTWERAAALARRWGLKQLAGRLGVLGSLSTSNP
jgi:exodeoxyribonuclease III